MSNFLAIATVTASLQRILQTALNLDVPGADVMIARPDGAGENGLPERGVNVYLYQVMPNIAWRNEDLPTRAPDGRLIQRPRIALDLYYLLTCYGSEGDLEPQRCLGSAVRTLHSQPVLTKDIIWQTLSDPRYNFLTTSDLNNEIETVKFTPLPLSLEELSKLWSVFFQTTYNLSVAYIASVVLIEATVAPLPVLPVQTRNILVIPSVSGTETPVIEPDQLEGLQLWLKSDADATYDSDGVSAWGDQSGSGNNALQPDAARRPSFVAAGIAGKPVLRFDGADDYLAIENLSYSGAGSVAEITVCALVRSSSTAPQMIVSFDGDRFWDLRMKNATNEHVSWSSRAATGARDDLLSPESYTDGQWHVICGWFQAGAALNKQLFVDGEAVAQTTAHGGNAIGRGGPTRFGFVGAASNAASFNGAVAGSFFAGDLAELLIYQRALTSSDLRAIERYFMDRYQ